MLYNVNKIWYNITKYIIKKTYILRRKNNEHFS